MQSSTFTPWGQTYFVGAATPTQVLCSNNQKATSYRLRNLGTSAAYIAWSAPTASGATPQIGAVAPSQGTPVPNCIGMVAGSVETISGPADAWFLASTAASFEVTPGEGM